ncbi:MAG: TlpA family protein disulfide reductase [Anaerolineales bacterium]|nr:TlpA family protein disulfide reductase [Anaerolineales bacterium]
MKTKHILFKLIVLTAFLIAACGGNPTTEAMMESTPDAMMSHKTPTADAMMPKETPSTEAMMESPAWFGMALTNVHTGETFTIQDFKGKVILVETMAIWCSNCLKQQTQVNALHGLVGNRDDFVSLGLDIDPNEDVSKLKSFVEGQGFDWLYSISPAEVSREIASLYGDQFLNPPSTPMLVIDRHGVVHPLPFGIKSAEELLQFIQPFLDESI